MTRARIESLEDAVSFLRSVGTEPKRVQRAWLLRDMDHNGAYIERMCESDADLIAMARAAREQVDTEPGRRGLPRSKQTLRPRLLAVRLRQAVLSDWPCTPLSQHRNEGGPCP